MFKHHLIAAFANEGAFKLGDQNDASVFVPGTKYIQQDRDSLDWKTER